MFEQFSEDTSVRIRLNITRRGPFVTQMKYFRPTHPILSLLRDSVSDRIDGGNSG